jgi:hypothetical protein
MMTLEQALFSYLGNYAGLKALVSTRIYPIIMPQNPTLPAVTYQKISGVVDYVMDGTSIKRPRIQVDAWAKSYGAVRGVAEQVKAALDRYTGTMGGTGGVEIIGTWIENETDLFEPDTGLYRVSLDFRFEHE